MQSKDEIVRSLRTFTSRRDDLLHEDVSTFDHHLNRFLEFCESDHLAKGVLALAKARSSVDLDAWWTAATQRGPKLSFPADPEEELGLRYRLIRSAVADPNRIVHLGMAHDQRKRAEWIEVFRTLIVRPFAQDLTNRLAEAADLATPEARAVQAVPLNRIPGSKEVKIFLSHKTADKPLVSKYHAALKTLGFDPWLDDHAMPAGSNLERELQRGFEESCAAVFFITDNFKEEKYLAAEIDHAVSQKRQKAQKFSIITLRYSSSADVPELLRIYVHKEVANDLQGFDMLLKALPIELGPLRWKAEVV
jgi:hypothetical protein